MEKNNNSNYFLTAKFKMLTETEIIQLYFLFFGVINQSRLLFCQKILNRVFYSIRNLSFS